MILIVVAMLRFLVPIMLVILVVIRVALAPVIRPGVKRRDGKDD